MATSLLSPRAAESSAFFPDEHIEERWYAAYTCANHEKRVAKQLEERAVEHFLPLYGSVRRWKDRKVKLELPFFPGYVFVHLALRDRLRVLQTPGVARLVGFGGLPTPLPDQEVEAMRNGLQRQLRLEPHPYLTIGRRVRLKSGPLLGLEGVLVRRKGLLRLVLSLDLIQRSVAVEVDVSDVESTLSTRAGQSSLSDGDTVWI
jgi:transcription antitermination factor NusG